ncbi:serine O-acetyltransferase EpsC [Hyphomicrobium sp.]|jgi:serine O-acetyltransferase|uniref:serine O-acetyltransferase EpsC n=1 Tax=Hyphomicrobium sp. TaxID=82 RepID=UPI002CB900D2|nr:serine O-acetyltransferase EpsC [Hyphomicrobium sp.]HVZ03969.1 serine O-acetyltransferase EpsC [Hyphomicrobium sp.]
MADTATLRSDINDGEGLPRQFAEVRQPRAASWDIEGIVRALKEARGRSKRVVAAGNRRVPLPSPERLQHAINGIYGALFPRHAGAIDHGDDALRFFIGDKLNSALHTLVEQIYREHAFIDEARAERDEKLSPEGIVADFSQQLPQLYETLERDIRAAYEGDPSAKSTEEVLLSFPGVRAVIHHRVAHALHELGAPVVARIIAELAHSQTGIDIHPGAKIGAGFFIDHGTGVVIGETAIIGDRVRLYQAVTLGAKRFSVDESGSLVKGNPRHPIIEDDVVIYAGATILGRVTIGHGSTIGGNVWLTRSVAPHSNVLQAQTRFETFDGGAGI